MRLLFFLLFIVLLLSCGEEAESPVSNDFTTYEVDVPDDVIEHVEIEEEIEYDTLSKIDNGAYYKTTVDGFIKLNINDHDKNKTYFVFDSWGPGNAKMAGEIIVDQNGKADFSMSGCQNLSFHFTEDGISIKEYNCRFHSKNYPFDGFYEKMPVQVEMSVAERETSLKYMQTDSKAFDFYAVFTEPFYTVHVVGSKLYVSGMDEQIQVFPTLSRFDPEAKKQNLFYINEAGAYKHLEILKEPGNDGMSDIYYPYDVKWGELHGGGARSIQKESYE